MNSAPPQICGSSHPTRNAESLYTRGNQVLCLARREADRCSARLEQNARAGEGQAAAHQLSRRNKCDATHEHRWLSAVQCQLLREGRVA